MYRPAPALLLLIGLGSALFLPALLGGRTFPARDAGATHIPWRAETQRQLAAGHAPLWNPLANGGRPLLANPNAQAAYPIALLLLPLGPELALASSLALHHILFILGCWVLARRAGAAAATAAVAAAAVGFSGVPLSATLLANLQASLAWGPWALAAALPRDGENHRRRSLLGGVCTGLSFLGGEPVTAALVALAWTVVTVWTAPRRAPARLGIAGAAAIGIAAPVLFPLLALYPDTARAALSASPAALAADALAPRRWPELVLPHLFGDFHAATAPDFWVAASFPWLRYFPALFVGVLPPLLAAAAGWSRRSAPWWVLAGAGTGGAVLFGIPTFASPLGPQHVRFAVKFLALEVLALPPLVALGWERLAKAGEASRRRLALVGACPVLAVLLLAAFPRLLARPLLAHAYPASAAALAEVPASTLSQRLALDAGALALPLVVFAAAPGAPLASTAALATGGVAATWGLLASEPAELWQRPPPLARDLPSGTRLAALAPAAAAPTGGAGKLARYRAMRAALLPNYPNRWGLATVLERGPDGLESARHELLAAAAATLPVAQRVRIAAALGAEVAITLDELAGPRGEYLGGVWRWRLEAAPQVYLARRVHPARGALAAAVTLASPAFRPGQDAVIEGDGGVEELPGAAFSQLAGLPHRLAFEVQAPAKVLLVVQQSHMRSWRADIDGRRVPIVTVNGAMMGVWVPPGRHRVRLAIDLSPYHLGLAGPLSVFLALLVTRRGAHHRALRDPAVSWRVASRPTYRRGDQEARHLAGVVEGQAADPVHRGVHQVAPRSQL